MSETSGVRTSSRMWCWSLIVCGIAVLALVANQVWLSLGSGSLQFASRKYGFVFSGADAVAMHIALTLGASLIIAIGWRGLHARANA